MNRRHLLFAAAGVFLASTTLARADEVGDIVRWLRQLGFDDITTSRSLLGRVQIEATGDIGVRELVVNPRTGEILRDVWLDSKGKVVRGKPYVRTADDDDSGHSGSGDGSGGGGGGDDSSHGGGDDNGGSDDNSDSGSDHDSGSDDGGGSDHGGDSNDH